MIHPTAQIASNAKLGESVVVHAGAVVGEEVELGAHVVVHEHTVLKRGVKVFDNAVLGRKPQSAGQLFRTLKASYPPLVVGEHSVIGACAVLYAGTTIGQRVLIGDLASIREECQIGDGSLIARLVTVNYHTMIGRNVKIMDFSHITGEMVIEDDVFISVEVATTNDNYMRTQPPKGQLPADAKGAWIKKGASIGANATLLPNIIIGEKAMVGAGSVVSRDVPPAKIVMGFPARVVRDVPSNLL